MTATVVSPAEPRAGAIVQSLHLSKRAVLSMVRQPQVIFPAIFFPLFFVALNSAAFDRVAGAQESFSMQFDSFLDFLLPTTVLQAVVFGASEPGAEMANDISLGFLDRLLASPVSRLSIVVGRLAGAATIGGGLAVVFTLVLLPFGVTIEGGAATLATFVVVSALMGLAVGGLVVALAIKTGSAEAVQSVSPLIFTLMFTSSAFFPHELMSGWYGAVARNNPVSWLLDAERELTTIGFSAEPAARAIAVAGIAAAIAVATSMAAMRGRLRSR